MINLSRGQMEKIENMQVQMGDIIREMRIIRTDQGNCISQNHCNKK